jgi:hypothetical protein
MVKEVRYERFQNVTDSSGITEDITNRVRLYTLDLAEAAEEGSVALSSLVVDDPDGDYDIIGWRRIWIYERAAAGSNNLTGVWWIADRTVERGPFETGTGRQWTLSLSDYNALLGLRVLHNPDADRPAETDIARLNWLVSTLGTPGITTTEYVNTAGPKNMDEADYRGQTRLDVISDCAQQSGKNYFIYIRNNGDNTHDRGLWYDFASSTAFSSPIRLSNVLSDIDLDFCFPISDDTQLVRDPSRTYSGAYVRFDGGAAYEESIAVADMFTRRDGVYDASSVKHLHTATNRALRYIQQSADEEDRIKTAFYVPEGKVNFVKAGMRLQFRATHLPGYESFTWLRVVKKQILEVSEAPESTYLMTLELASAGSTLPSTCPARGGSLTVHTLAHPSYPTSTWMIWTGPTFQNMTLRVDDILPGDYTYSVPAGQCCVWLIGHGPGEAGVEFDGITFTPGGGSATYYPENGDGSGGHFFEYRNAIPNEFTGAASTWFFPQYQRANGAATGGVTDYGIGFANGIAFVLP